MKYRSVRVLSLPLAAGLLMGCQAGADTENRTSAAQQAQNGEMAAERPPHGPPPEALAACQDLAADAACTFEIGAETITGRCWTLPGSDRPLACRPDRPLGPHPGMHHGPPPEALAACQELAVDAACSVKLGERTITGKCMQGPGADHPLACRPDRPLGPHPGMHHGPPPEALAACQELAVDAACSVKLGERTIPGTCRPGPRPDLPAACVPAGPPR
jgi:hypothetical protein